MIRHNGFNILGENARSCTGLLEWESKSGALEGLIAANHHEIPNNQGKMHNLAVLSLIT